MTKEKDTFKFIKSAQDKLNNGDYKGAIDDCDKAIAIEPRNPNYYWKRGIAKSRLGDNKGANEDFLKSAKVNNMKDKVIDLGKEKKEEKIKEKIENYRREREAEKIVNEEDWELLSSMFDKTEDELKKDYSCFLEDKFKGSFIEYEFTLEIAAEKLLSKSNDEIKSDKDQKEDKYVGEIINGKPNGNGTKTFANGNTYSGEWKNGDFHGKGTYINNYGQRFEGYWKNGKIYNGELFYKKGIYPNSQDEK